VSCEFICDGCGKRAKAAPGRHSWCKPNNWFQRSDPYKIQDACSRLCIDEVAKKSGKTGVVFPL